MSKILTTLAVMGISITAMAQPVWKVGPEVGGTFVTMTQKINGETRETQYQPGFKIGGALDIGFNHFSVQPGLFLSANNGTESFHQRNFATGAGLPTSDQDRRRYHITYLQVPVYALYKTGDEYSGHFFAGGGPYLGIAVGGRFQQDYTNTLNGVDITKRYDYTMPIGDGEKDKIRRMDFGLQATVGYETSFGLYFRAFYGAGLVNTAPLGDADNSFHQMGGGLTIGYFFNISDRQRF